MHIRSLASVALVAFAAQAFAQQAKPFKRSITTGRDLGFMRRADDGYQPEDEVCNKGGNTCAEACGTGYEQCKSTDQAVHCYNPAAGETCCSTNTGNSCLSSFYCTHDTTSETFCCPGGMNLGDCAVKHGVTGALTSDVPVPTTTSTPPPSSTSTTSTSAPPTTTSATSSSVVVTTSSSSSSSSSSSPSSSAAPSTIITTTSFSPSPSPSAGTSTLFAAANSTLATTSTASGSRSGPAPTSAATTSATAPDKNAASSSGPAGVAVLLGAALVAALL